MVRHALWFSCIGLCLSLVACTPNRDTGDDDEVGEVGGSNSAYWIRYIYPLAGEGQVQHMFTYMNRAVSCSGYQGFWEVYDEYVSAADQLYQSLELGKIESEEYERQSCLLTLDYAESMDALVGNADSPGTEATSISLYHPDAVEEGEPIAGVYVLEDWGESDEAWDDDDDDGPPTSEVLPTFESSMSRQVGPGYWETYAAAHDCDGPDPGQVDDLDVASESESFVLTEGELEVVASGSSAWSFSLTGGVLSAYDDQGGESQSFALDVTFQQCDVVLPDSYQGVAR